MQVNDTHTDSQSATTTTTTKERLVLPSWVETAEKPPWPDEPVFVDEGGTFFNETSITRLKVNGKLVEGFPVGNDSDVSGYWPEALWKYNGEIVFTPFEATEFVASDVRSWSVLGSSGVSRNWEDVEWERIPDEIKPTEKDRSSWDETRDVFGEKIWIHKDEYAVSYSDSLPGADEMETVVTPPWPEKTVFNTFDSDITVTSIGSINQLVKARGKEGTVCGFVVDTVPLRLWTENGNVVKLSDYTIIGEALATYFDKLHRFPKYDSDKHRDPIHNVDTKEDNDYIDPQLNNDVGSECKNKPYIDSLSTVYTLQTSNNDDGWGLGYRVISNATADKLLSIYRGSVDHDVFKLVDDAVANWVNDPQHATEFHATGEIVTGNKKHTPDDVNSKTITALQSFSEFTTAYLEATERSRLTLYRYLDSEIADELLDAESVVRPRAAASWTTSIDAAAETAQTVWHTSSNGVIIEAKIPAENILATSEVHSIFNNRESEMIVALPEEIDLSNMKIHGHGEYNPNNK